MKRCNRSCIFLTVLGLMAAARAPAQSFKTLHAFGTNGLNPYAELVLSGSTLYGTAVQPGGAGGGIVFKVNTDGTAFAILHTFTALSGPASTNSDGADPFSGLLLSGDTLFGVAKTGGSYGNGTVFALNTNGTPFTNLHSFAATGGLNPGNWPTNSDGATPYGTLILSSNTLYGTASGGGAPGWGTVFALNTDGTGFTNLHAFNYFQDGAFPYRGLLLSGNVLYGTAEGGALEDNGTVFALNTDGTGFRTLHSFTMLMSYLETNTDGAVPASSLIISGNTLYGTANLGGERGIGTVFGVNTDSSSFSTLYSFTLGGRPQGGLILAGDTLYGTAAHGGAYGIGSVFTLKTDGTGYTNLYSFSGANDGTFPAAGLVLSGDTLYGTTQGGGVLASGTVFSLSFRPQLTLVCSGPNVVLTWPTNSAGFDYTDYVLQSTANLAPPASWTTNLPAPVVVSGRFSVTTPLAGSQMFFRLAR